MNVKKISIVAGAIILLGFSLACGTGGGSSDTSGPGTDSGDSDTTSTAPSKAAGHIIVWKATTSAGSQIDVTYGVGGDTSQANGVDSPWTKTTKSTDAVTMASMVVQNKGESGDVTCTITIDGKVAKTNKSSGQYALATCEYDNF